MVAKIDTISDGSLENYCRLPKRSSFDQDTAFLGGYGMEELPSRNICFQFILFCKEEVLLRERGSSNRKIIIITTTANQQTSLHFREFSSGLSRHQQQYIFFRPHTVRTAIFKILYSSINQNTVNAAEEETDVDRPRLCCQQEKGHCVVFLATLVSSLFFVVCLFYGYVCLYVT